MQHDENQIAARGLGRLTLPTTGPLDLHEISQKIRTEQLAARADEAAFKLRLAIAKAPLCDPSEILNFLTPPSEARH